MTQTKALTPRDFFQQDNVKAKFRELLHDRAPAFITSVMQVVTQNRNLSQVDPVSVYNAACMAAILDLPVNQNLGFAWIVPYKNEAQFQLGVKGFVQLAQRTGQYKHINVIPVYESQFESWDSLREELKADFTKPESGEVKGYCAHFELLNGFQKTVYWPSEKVRKHAQRYSKSFNSGPWQSHFDEMAMKTVLKHALSKWGILSIELQRAVVVDQAVIKDDEGNEIEYADTVELKPDAGEVNDMKEDKRIKVAIEKAKTTHELAQIEGHIKTDEQRNLFDERVNMLKS